MVDVVQTASLQMCISLVLDTLVDENPQEQESREANKIAQSSTFIN
jgi:hypothetical protein